ncbi:hypothetical protein EDB89DRAFT_2073349 [Lactarius sanguifluus]|nr:hypothetical protein EDB89DRAFT_2073349 [Lactarius sanguifluus]
MPNASASNWVTFVPSVHAFPAHSPPPTKHTAAALPTTEPSSRPTLVKVPATCITAMLSPSAALSYPVRPVGDLPGGYCCNVNAWSTTRYPRRERL